MDSTTYLARSGNMSNTSTSATVTANLAQQSSAAPLPGSPPPLLPAFLITGLLLAAIVTIIVWRHIIERRHIRRDDDPTWPIDVILDSSGSPKGPTPTIWDLEVMNEREWVTWEDIMPLSATPLRAAPKPRRPRYLVPSDRPVTFFSRMFGSEPTQPPPPLPPIAVFFPNQPLPFAPPDDDEGPIDRLQVAVLISLPHPRRVRNHASCLLEKTEESADTRSPLPPLGNLKGVEDGLEAEDTSLPCKGKKRSLEKPISYGYDLKANCDYDDEDGPSEVAFGTVTIPFLEEG